MSFFFNTRDEPTRRGGLVTFKTPRKGRIVGAITSGVLAVLAVICLFASLNHIDQSDIGFGVSKGMLDPNKGKVSGDLLGPGMHVLGLVDGVWTFPAYKTLRYEDFEVQVTTKDGKQLTINGQYGFRFVGEKDPALAKEFAQGIGARKYGGKRPGESDEGWQNFLHKIVDVDATSVFKDSFGRVSCADFEPSCRSIDPRTDVPDTKPEEVYSVVATALQGKVTADLGAAYLLDFRVKVKSISLPREVQRNIDLVTAEQAKTKAAEQSEHTATAEAAAIRTKAAALRDNKELVAVEVAKACHGGDNCTIIVDGTGNANATVSTGK